MAFPFELIHQPPNEGVTFVGKNRLQLGDGEPGGAEGGGRAPLRSVWRGSVGFALPRCDPRLKFGERNDTLSGAATQAQSWSAETGTARACIMTGVGNRDDRTKGERNAA